MRKSKKSEQGPYEQLAKVLDRIPNGFVAVEDNTHLEVLQWIFEPEEAELASKLKLRGETLKRISKRLKIPQKELSRKLETMERKGQIYVMNSKKGKKYGLLPFAIGIYEEQLHRMDKEFAQLMEEYMQKTQGEVLFSTPPPIHRVIPVNEVIKTELEIHPYNKAEEMIRNAKSWGVRECICRKQQGLLGEPCQYPTSVCLMFSAEKNAYEDSNKTKPISLNKALEILKEAEEAGLVHSSMNIANGQSYLCNCCTCCCGVLRAFMEFKQPNALVKADYVLSVDTELCVGCGKCVDRCQFHALAIVDEKCSVNNKCVGCGACAIVCPTEALSLVPRENGQKNKPPRNIVFWMLRRAIKRRINLLKIL